VVGLQACEEAHGAEDIAPPSSRASDPVVLHSA
jgi:hypothetical protein